MPAFVATLTLIALLVSAPPTLETGVTLAVPVLKQARERCGPTALEMVFRFYGADSSAAIAASAYDPVLRGALITDLAAAARRAGFQATVDALDDTALVALLREGVPPIVLYQNGTGPLTLPHYAVVAGWDPRSRDFLLNDGTTRQRTMSRTKLVARWTTAGRRALVVRPPQ